METRSRSLFKAVIWNFIGMVCMCAIGFLTTISMVIGGFMAVLKTVFGFAPFLIYERLWAGNRWAHHV